jgi:phage gp36-like protein
MAVYCEVKDVGSVGINADAIRGIDPADITAEIGSTSALMDTYFGDRFVLPLTQVDDSIKKCCAVLTGVALLRVRGYSPDADPSVGEAAAFWTRWLEKVATGVVRPQVVDSSVRAPNTGFPGARVVTATSRGLSARGTGCGRQPFQGD